MRHFFDHYFKDRRQVEECDGMQIFRHVVVKSWDECETHHINEICLHLIRGVPSEKILDGGIRVCSLAGLMYQAAQADKIPYRWHIEYLRDRWFKRIDPPKWRPDIDGYVPNNRLPELITECRLVVDEWEVVNRELFKSVDEFEKFLDSQFEKPDDIQSKSDHLVDNLCAVIGNPLLIKDDERQRIYEMLHNQYGCRIYP